MKKLVLFFILIISQSILFASGFNSNSIGQIIEVSDEEENDNLYILEKDEQDPYKEILLKDGEVVWEKTTTEEDTKKTITYTYPDKTEIFEYDKNLLVSHLVTKDNYTQTYSYNYNNGHLVFVSYSDSDNNTEVEYYLRSSSDNSLLGIRRFSNASLIGDYYLYEEQELYSQLSDDFVVAGDFNVEEDGNIVYEKDGITSTYTPTGLLIKEEKEDSIRTYQYDKGFLQLSVLTEGSKTFEYRYNNGVLVSQIDHENGQITQYIVYNPDGMVRTIYSNGKKVADILYKSDNKKVKEIKYY